MPAFINGLPGTIALGLIWGIFAVGLFITFRVLNFADLTVDGSICTGGVVATICLLKGLNPILAILLAFLCGIVAGVVTGLFNTLLGIPPILAGILTQLMLWSINLKILGRANQSVPANLGLINGIDNLKTILIVLLFVAIIIGLLYWFFGTSLGSAIRSTGNNEKMSSANGININVMKVLGLGLSNGLIALSGSLLVQFQGFADINMGRGAIVIGLASIIIGTSLSKLVSKNFAITLIGCVVGSIIYYFVYQLVVYLGFDTDLLKMLTALVVALFLGLPYLKNKLIKPKKKEAN